MDCEWALVVVFRTSRVDVGRVGRRSRTSTLSCTRKRSISTLTTSPAPSGSTREYRRSFSTTHGPSSTLQLHKRAQRSFLITLTLSCTLLLYKRARRVVLDHCQDTNDAHTHHHLKRRTKHLGHCHHHQQHSSVPFAH